MTRSILPFAPTRDRDGYPSACHCCGRHAVGLGIGDPGRGDPKYLCEECVLLVEQIKSIRGWNAYERAAVTKAVENVGAFLEKHGTDLGEWDEQTAEDFVRAIWLSCADGLRAVVRDREVPF
jgi:hypothetical protein